MFPATRNTLNDCMSQHETRKKERGNLEQLDYLQDLNRVLFSNVVDQAAQETAYWSAYTTWGGINKPAAAAKSLAYISLL